MSSCLSLKERSKHDHIHAVLPMELFPVSDCRLRQRRRRLRSLDAGSWLRDPLSARAELGDDKKHPGALRSVRVNGRALTAYYVLLAPLSKFHSPTLSKVLTFDKFDVEVEHVAEPMSMADVPREKASPVAKASRVYTARVVWNPDLPGTPSFNKEYYFDFANPGAVDSTCLPFNLATVFVILFFVFLLVVTVISFVQAHADRKLLEVVQRDVFMETGSIECQEQLLEEMGIKPGKLTKKTWLKKAAFALLIHHPVTGMLLSMVDIHRAKWTKAQRLMLQMHESIGCRVLVFITDMCSVAFAMMVLNRSADHCFQLPAARNFVRCEGTGCAFRFEPCSDDWEEFCCETTGWDRFFTKGWVLRQLAIQVLSQLLHLPLRRLVPFFLGPLQTSFQSVTRPLKRKQLPGASLAYILQVQRKMLELPLQDEVDTIAAREQQHAGDDAVQEQDNLAGTGIGEVPGLSQRNITHDERVAPRLSDKSASTSATKGVAFPLAHSVSAPHIVTNEEKLVLRLPGRQSLTPARKRATLSDTSSFTAPPKRKTLQDASRQSGDIENCTVPTIAMKKSITVGRLSRDREAVTPTLDEATGADALSFTGPPKRITLHSPKRITLQDASPMDDGIEHCSVPTIAMKKSTTVGRRSRDREAVTPTLDEATEPTTRSSTGPSKKQKKGQKKRLLQRWREHRRIAIDNWLEQRRISRSTDRPDDDNPESAPSFNGEFLELVRMIRMEEWAMWTTNLRDYRVLLSAMAYTAVAFLAVVPIFVLLVKSCSMEDGETWVLKFLQNCTIKYTITETGVILVKFVISLVSVTWFSGQDLSEIFKKIFSCSKNTKKVHPGFTSEDAASADANTDFKTRDELGATTSDTASPINSLINYFSS